ncbi:hypothetical protein LguiB_003913 [Lonicera macranthoides]
MLRLVLEASATLVALIFIYKFCRFKTNKQIQAPEPSGAWPIIGHLHFLGNQTSVCRTLAAMADKHGPVYKIRLGMRNALIVSGKEAVTECFAKNDRVFLTRPQTVALTHMGYNGAFFGLAPYSPFWQEMRKISTLELLSNRRLEMLKSIRASELGRCIKDLYTLCIAKSAGTTFDIGRWFQQVTMNTMIQMIAGKRYSVIGDAETDVESRRFEKAMKEFMHLSGVFEFSDVFPFFEWIDLQGQVKRMKKVAKELDYFMSSWIEEHVIERRQKGVNVRNHEGDFMDVMLSLFENDDFVQGHKSKDVIKATSLNLILAGADTTAITMTWALSLLLNHDKVLKRAQEELDTQVGKERLVEESDIKNLVYFQAIVKETMRLYPAGPLSVPREAMEDCYVGGYHVPKGTRLLVNIWKLHRDPSTWTDSLEFQPERFLTSHTHVDVRGRQFEFIPFSSGRRACPGITAAMQTIQLTLARLLQSFSVATPSNAPVDMGEGSGLSMPKIDPLEVVLTPRLPAKFCPLLVQVSGQATVVVATCSSFHRIYSTIMYATCTISLTARGLPTATTL